MNFSANVILYYFLHAYLIDEAKDFPALLPQLQEHIAKCEDYIPNASFSLPQKILFISHEVS